jgi:hypothetical protein
MITSLKIMENKLVKKPGRKLVNNIQKTRIEG